MSWAGVLLLVAALALMGAGYCAAGAAVRRAAVSQQPQGAAAYEVAVRAEIEREWRAASGMPAAHPESLTSELDGADEAWLDAAARELWPCREYDNCEFGEGDP